MRKTDQSEETKPWKFGEVPEPYIGDLDDPNIEEYEKDNQYVLHGQRIGFYSWVQSARSLFMLHNETMNVWSHLLGAIAFVCTFIYVLFYLQAVPNTTY